MPWAFVLRSGNTAPPRRVSLFLADTTSSATSSGKGLGQAVLDMALNSPLWKYVLVPQARKKISDTAEENGIPWNKSLDWLSSQDGPWKDDGNDDTVLTTREVPAYYQKAFHSYENGNLCWEAALEVELASCAVGARNFPTFGPRGEETFRGAFASVFEKELHVSIPDQAVIVDMGCGTGMSLRPLARNYPHAKHIIGFDLSPYYISVGKRLLELAPRSFLEGGSWVSSIDFDPRIDFRVGNAASTPLPAASVDVVNVQFVVHEMPIEVSKQVMDEAYRILKPGGQLLVGEMDFQSPGYAAQRANPLLFALIRATEPYLDTYAEGQSELREHIANKFATTRISAATGRHYALRAIKHQDDEDASKPGTLQDDRFDANGVYRVEDTHLQVWENKAYLGGGILLEQLTNCITPTPRGISVDADVS